MIQFECLKIRVGAFHVSVSVDIKCIQVRINEQKIIFYLIAKSLVLEHKTEAKTKAPFQSVNYVNGHGHIIFNLI